MDQLRMTHGLALSNLAVFVAKEYGFFEEFDLDVELLRPSTPAEIVSMLRHGEAQMASYAFTNLMKLYEESAMRIVGGSGVLGLMVLAQPEIKSWHQLRGKSAVTLTMDPMEVLLYESLEREDVPYASLRVQYASNPQELTQAFIDGHAAVTHVEPYATLLRRQYGASLMTDGTDLWGGKYPDCVVTTPHEFILRRPDIVRRVLQALLHAQAAIEADLSRACQMVTGRYYRASAEELVDTAASMPPGIDIRDQKKVILDRGPSMVALGYIKQPPGEDFLDFSLLEEAIREERNTWKTLKVKSEQ